MTPRLGSRFEKGLGSRIEKAARGPLPLGCLLLAGVVLRLHDLGAQSIWYDEAFSISLASQSASDIVSRVEPDHLPLHFLLLHFWMLLAGQSELAVRYLSLAFGVLAIPLTYVLARRLFDRWTAVAAASIAAVSPFFVYYSQETRMYSLVAAQALLSTYLLVRAVAGERRAWLPYAAVVVSLLYTHYYGLLFFGAQAAFTLAWGASTLRRQRAAARSTLLPWLGAMAGIALSFLPWTLARAHVFETYVSAARASLSLEGIFWKSAISFSLGHSVEALNPNSATPRFAEDHQLAVLLSAGFLLVAAVGLLGTLRRRGGDTPLLLFVLLVVPVIAVYLVSIGRREFTARYLTPVAPIYYLLLASGLDVMRRRSGWLLGVGAVFIFAAMGYSLANYFGEVRYSRDDYRSAAAYLLARARPGEAVLCNARYSRLALDYYRPGREPCVGLPAEYPPDREATEARAAALAQAHPFLWLVLWQDYYSDPDQYLERWLDGHAFAVEERRFHGGIRVKGYLTRPPLVSEAMVPNRLDATLGDRVRLLGYEVEPARAGEPVRVVLYWQALAPLPESYTVFVHLVSLAGERWAQHDSPPVGGSYPTTEWPVGSVVRDEHVLSLPAFTPPVEFHLEVGMYEPASLRRLGESDQDRVAIPGVRVERGAGGEIAVPNRPNADFDGRLALRGYELGPAKRGETLSAVLYWQALARVDADYTVFVHLLDAEGRLRAQGDAPPAGGIYPTSIWSPGETVRDARALALPADLPAGEYRLVVGLYEPGSGRRLSVRSGWLGSRDDKVVLGTVRLE